MRVSDSLTAGPHVVTARPVDAADTAFLQAVYASTRETELEGVPWSDDQKRRFLEQQFRAQDHAYRNNYPGAEFFVLRIDQTDAGRLYLHRRPTEIRVMDIALLPAFRRCGVGTTVLSQIIAEGRQTGRAVTIHVEVFNPAQRLYERLGFRHVSQSEVYQLMEWRPDHGTGQ
ncbi:MAG TPA: GNAT family N-acetyltransferase [Opitutaceae bacterium]